MLKNRNHRGSRATSSEKWRSFYAPHILNLLEKYINIKNIKSIYRLHLFEYSEENVENVLKLFYNGKFEDALKIGVLPIEFEEWKNIIGSLLFIEEKEINFLAIICDNENFDTFKPDITYFSQFKIHLNINDVIGRSLVYPI